MSSCATKECGAEETDITIEDMKRIINEKFTAIEHLEVDDLGTCGTSYQVVIVSVSFFNKC